MAIKDRNLKVGTVLKARYKSKVYMCHVTDRGGGQTGFTLMDKGMPKDEYKSPSTAGRAVMGGIACNGWRFWSLATDFDAGNGQRGQAKADRKAPKKAVRGPAKKPAAARRVPNPEAKQKPFACGECGQDYAEQEEAEACLDSHRAEAEAAQEPGSQAAVPA